MRHFSRWRIFSDHLTIRPYSFHCSFLLPLHCPFIVILNEVKNLNAPTSALQILRFAQDDTMGVMARTRWRALARPQRECDDTTWGRNSTVKLPQQIKAPLGGAFI